MGILRSAPIGVIVTHRGKVPGKEGKRTVVYFGNDRAEAILDTPLPRLHLNEDSIIDIDVEQSQYDVLKEHDKLRQYWIESSYDLVIKGKRLRVRGSPLLLANSELATYGVLIDPDDDADFGAYRIRLVHDKSAG